MGIIDFDKIKDILGLSKPLTKLIEVIAQGTGAISKPYLIKKNADAKAYEIKVISKAIRKNQETLQKIDYDESKLSLSSLSKNDIQKVIPLSERTENRINYQEQKRQQNIENVTQIAAEQLESEETVSEEKVNEDWTTRFFNYAQDVSDEEMQSLWGRILAGEVKQPKSFSLRTLELIRNLSKEDAEIFSRVANYAILHGNDAFLYKKNDILEKFNIGFNELALLEEIGLLHAGEFLSFEFLQLPNDKQNVFRFGKTIVIYTKKANSNKKSISIRLFTRIGKELLTLIEKEPDFKYIQEFSKEFRSDTDELKYGQILAYLDNGRIRHSNLQDIPLE
jgi:hypothetical protein